MELAGGGVDHIHVHVHCIKLDCCVNNLIYNDTNLLTQNQHPTIGIVILVTK